MIKAIYFDLFFALIVPTYEKTNNEYNILNLSVSEWEQYAENDILYHERALGFVKTEIEIIDKIMSLMPFEVSVVQKEQVLLARQSVYFVVYAENEQDAKEKVLRRTKETLSFIHNAKADDFTVEEFTKDTYDGCLCFY